MRESFGARLRQRREQQGIDLVVIAEQTKIKRSLLEALERDDVSHWPAGIYRRAYIRTYAQAIGLDPDLVSREFLRVHPEPVDVAAIEEIASLADGSRGTGGPPMRLRNIMGSALGSFSWRRRNTAAEPPLPPVIDGTSVDFDVALTGPVEEPAEAPTAYPVMEEASAEPVEDVLPRAEAAPAPGQAQQPGNPAEPDPVTGLDEATQPDPDVQAVASLCTRFGQVASPDDLPPLLRESADILNAAGLIVWLWDPSVNGLRAGLLYGYSEKVRSQLPTVPRDADNATAAAFRSAETCVIEGNGHVRGALVIPLLTPDECAGVLAIELEQGGEQRPCLRAVATIIGAQLAHLAARSRPVEAQPEPEMLPAAVGETVSPRFRAHVGR
jgi:transcriptional regulator with XRE-family HTH domain